MLRIYEILHATSSRCHFMTFSEMREADYLDLERKILSHLPTDANWHKCLTSLLTMNSGERKAVVAICRCQFDFQKDRTNPNYVKLLDNLSTEQIIDYTKLCDSPLHAGLLYSFVRYAPYSSDIIHETKLKSIQKEMKVMTSIRRNSELNFASIFDGVDIPIHHTLPYNSQITNEVRRALGLWKKSMSKKLHFPRYSNKTCSDDTFRDAKDKGIIDEYANKLSLFDIERIYHDTGIKLGGICEMRQRWLPSQLSPRTYYTMGGIAYHKSKYLQNMFSELCDSLGPTHKSLSLHPDRLYLNETQYGYIYDLSSFSSNLHEHANFLRQLSSYCKGTQIRIMDSWKGVITTDLGDMISEYVTLHEEILVSLEKVRFKTGYLVVTQEIAGLLGVYGNISSAKFLHGVVMSQLIDNMESLNVAGDDGIIAVEEDYYAYNSICLMGDMAIDKAYETKYSGCICLKRKIDQVGSRLHKGDIVIWPSYEYPNQEHRVDERYEQITRMTIEDRKKSTSATIVGFLKQLKYMEVDEYDKRLIDSYIQNLYRISGLPVGGNIPQLNKLNMLVSTVMGDYISEDPIAYTIAYNYSGHVFIPNREQVKFTSDMLTETNFTCNSTKLLSYLTRMGYIKSEKRKVYLTGEEGYDAILREFSTTLPCLNDYEIVTSIPPKFIP